MMAKLSSKATPLNINWDLTQLWQASESDFVNQCKQVRLAVEGFVAKWESRTDYLESVLALVEALQDYAAWLKDYGSDGVLGYYYGLCQALDQSDVQAKAKLNKLQELSTELINKIQFFELRLGRVPQAKQLEFLQAEELKAYHHFLSHLFTQAKFSLSEAEEKIVNLYQPMAWSNWTKLRSELISQRSQEVLTETGEQQELPFEECLQLTSSTQKQVRDSAAQAVNSILQAELDVATAELNTILQTKQVSDKLRGYTRPDQARHIADDIATQAVDALIQAVSSQFAIPSRFYQLKARLLGLTKLAYHERNIEFGSLNQQIEYADAVEIVRKAVYELDPEFEQIFSTLLQGRIDVYPKLGKVGGAFCTHSLITQPVFILLNYQPKVSGVTTLAHELGHAINYEMMRKVCSPLDFGTSLATAEVASTFFEDFALAEVAKDADSQTRLALNMAKLNDDISTIFRQVACYKFEQELHARFREVGYLSTEEIGSLFSRHMAAYMGEYVEQSPGSQNWWVYWGHIRRPFYVYSYASGLIISKAMQAKVKQDASFISEVKSFLAAGESNSPVELFAGLGLDITNQAFWQEGVSEVEKLLVETEQLAAQVSL